MVKLSYFLPQASDPVAMKKQLVECGVLDLTNELIYKMAPEAVDPAILSRGSLSIRQYTRSALKLLRDDLLSIERPFCMNDPKIRQMDIWKFSYSYKHQDNYSIGNDDRSISSYGHLFENRNGSFRQYPPYRSRSFNDGGRNFTSSNHLMPPFMVRQQKQNANDKEIYFGPKRESFEMKNEQIERDKSEEKIELKELESEENNVNQTKNSELTVEKGSEQQNERGGQNSPFTYPQDGDDECSIDGKNIDRKNQSTTISSKSNAEVGASNPFLNRDDRRIGSGRISLGNEWEYFNKDIDKNTVKHNSQQFTSEELQMSRQDEEKNSSIKRFHTNRNRRRYDSYSSKSNTSNDEPEWFSAGPTSRLEVIELHGFDDDCSSIASDSKNAVASAGADKSGINNKKDDEIASVTTSQSSPPPARSTPTKFGYKKYENRAQNSNNHNQNVSNKNEFIFDTFFNPFVNASGDDKKTHRAEPENRSGTAPWYDSSSSNINLHRDPNPQAPNRKSFYDNWANNATGKNAVHQNDLFNNNNTKTQLPYRVANVEELEAKMFHAGKTNQENLMQMLANMNNKQYQNQQYQDKEKFKYLINQMSSVNFGNKSVNFYQEQQRKHFYLLKHQQQQDILRVAEILQKFAAYSLTAVPIHQMNRAEILNRPEAQALLQAIVRNEITINSLVQIVNNGAVPYATRNSIFEYNREIILTVLNFIQLQRQHQQQQQAALQINSQLNLMNNFLPISQNMPQRVPSARELQFHTQSIMKSALLRKKMEGQKNQANSINDSFSDFMLDTSLSTSGNPLSSIHAHNNKFQQQNKLFTPTSVLKNINAGNKNNSIWQKIQTPTKLISDNGEIQNKFDFDGHAAQSNSNIEQTQKHIQWTKPELYKPNNIKSIGRSILKKSTYETNSNDESIQNLQIENSEEFEMNHQQQQEPSSTLFSNISPSKSQLSKWFTPELLAQASAGKLPSLNRNEVVFLEEFEKNAHQS